MCKCIQFIREDNQPCPKHPGFKLLLIEPIWSWSLDTDTASCNSQTIQLLSLESEKEKIIAIFVQKWSQQSYSLFAKECPPLIKTEVIKWVAWTFFLFVVLWRSENWLSVISFFMIAATENKILDLLLWAIDLSPFAQEHVSVWVTSGQKEVFGNVWFISSLILVSNAGSLQTKFVFWLNSLV